jgi:hypothetical protein
MSSGRRLGKQPSVLIAGREFEAEVIKQGDFEGIDDTLRVDILPSSS